MSPILFLDIDGVINTRPGSLDADKLELLAGIVRETGCEIVLSSTWRKAEHQLVRISAALESIGLELSGATPSLEITGSGMIKLARPRCEEIQAFLSCYGGGKRPFVILDDEPDFGPLAGHHVRTRPDVGLTVESAREVVGRFSGLKPENPKG